MTPNTNISFSRRDDGLPLHPGTGIVPILKEIGNGRLSVIGTGFYVTRYGLFVTAKHVLEDLQGGGGASLMQSFVCHLAGESNIYLRKIRMAHLLVNADIGIAQADNYLESYPHDPLQNLRATLSTQFPIEGEPLTTYAYPENEILDFNRKDRIPEIKGDYFQGGFLRYVENPEHPFLRFPYFETSVEIRSGASGGPIFNSQGQIIGVNCRGWDFRGGEHEGDSLSYIVPISNVLDIDVDMFMVPKISWEFMQIPQSRRGRLLSGHELAKYGHLLFEPPLSNSC